MNKNYLNTLIIFTIIIFLYSCKEKQNTFLIEQEEMTDILVDMHLIDGVLSVTPFPYKKENLRSENLYLNILKKRGISRQKFDSALTQYTKNREIYIKMYDNVIEKLKIIENQTLATSNQEDSLKYELYKFSFFTNFDSYQAIDKSSVNITEEKAFSGKCSYKITKDQKYSHSYSAIINQPAKVFEINIKSQINWGKKIDKYPKISFKINDKNGKVLINRSYSTSVLKNLTTEWKQIKAKYRLEIPHSKKNIKLSVYFWNPYSNEFYIDDYSIDVTQIK